MTDTTTHMPAPRTAAPDSPTHARRGEARPFDAILFSSFGGPDGQDDVIPFLRNVTRGRGIPDERLEEVAGHYRALGGRSPITEQNEAIIAALAEELARRDVDLPIYFGNRNWAPYNAEAVRALHADGHRHALGLVTSAYSSYSSCRQYREDFGMVLEETGLAGEVTIDKVRVYFNHPGFLAPVVDGVEAALASLASEGHDSERIAVLFSTHSVPTAMAEASGPEETRVEGSGGWYVEQHLAACRWVMDQLHDDAPELPDWQLVYQSRSGAPHIPWLEPDVNDVIARLAEEDSADAVVVVPIGFVTDHVEVVWDLDTEAKETAEEKGLAFRRVATSGEDPRFIAALADLVQERLDESFPRRVVTDFGGTPDVCGVNCCAGRICRPTTSAVDSASDVERARAERRATAGDGQAGTGSLS
ncbi:ferrochelatase [Brachybacterium paraconglomeratum]|uniref:ferrochelatase n=1 Tax=Brachybacterium paraconglomeratum TaxID=173362 RepID=UPI0021F0909C|nr:ferrochelatase [Brachybacterium paraconglomeratum]MCT1436429.1 ferrochelatase [Brachybacterium paraconglomeratum]